MMLLIADTGRWADWVPPLIQTFLRQRVEGMIDVADHDQCVTLPPIPKGAPMVLASCFGLIGTPAVLPYATPGQCELVAGSVHRRLCPSYPRPG